MRPQYQLDVEFLKSLTPADFEIIEKSGSVVQKLENDEQPTDEELEILKAALNVYWFLHQAQKLEDERAILASRPRTLIQRFHLAKIRILYTLDKWIRQLRTRKVKRQVLD